MAKLKLSKVTSDFGSLSLTDDISPGSPQRGEVATGLLVRSISINGDYLLCEQCSISPNQDITLEYFAGQGGPNGAIANIGMRKTEGRFSFFLRKRRDGTLEPAVKTLLLAAHAGTSFRIDTNHVLNHPRLTAEFGGTYDNQLLSMDCCVISSLKISVGASSEVKIDVTIGGLIDVRSRSKVVTVVPSSGLAGRSLNLTECSVTRFASSGRTVSSIEFSIANELEYLAFIPPFYADNRDNAAVDTPPLRPDSEPRPYSFMADQASFVGIKQSKWSGGFDEIIRLGLGTESFEHGGWAYRPLEAGGVSYSDDMVMNFGPVAIRIPTPLYQISSQDIVPGVFLRKASFLAQMRASTIARQGVYITFTESPD